MNHDTVAGINENELRSLGLEILDYIDRISDIFDKLDNCIDRLPQHYKSEACDKLIDRYKELSQYYPIVKENLASYSDDFICLIKKMRVNDKYLASLFKEYTDDILSIKKTIN